MLFFGPTSSHDFNLFIVFDEINLLSIVLLSIVFKCIKGLCSANLTKILQYKKHNCRANDYLLLETRKVKTKYGKRTYDYAGSRFWNALPLNIREEEKVENFKKQIKTLLFVDTEGFRRKAFRYE